MDTIQERVMRYMKYQEENTFLLAGVFLFYLFGF